MSSPKIFKLWATKTCSVDHSAILNKLCAVPISKYEHHHTYVFFAFIVVH